MGRVIIIGGGPAGMMAGIFSAKMGNEVHIFEKNEKLGKKLFITGKGRCNLTNACEKNDLMKNIMRNSRFMFSSLYSFDNETTMSFFEENGLRLKTERGMRVFPESDHSSDVIKTLQKELDRLGVNIHLNSAVNDIIIENNTFKGILYSNKEKMYGDSCIVATGGISYPQTGSTGDGYRFAKKAGHTVTDTKPSLTGIETVESFPADLQGLSLKNVSLTLLDQKKKIYSDLGEMLFTHYGISGPLVLSASSYIAESMLAAKNLPKIIIDLKPALSEEMLEKRITRDFETEMNKSFKNSLDMLLPQRLTEIVIGLSGIDPEKKVNAVTKAEKQKLVSILKNLELNVKKLRDYPEAIITKGGVDVKEIDPKTMSSKKCSGLYFAGEVLDIDALTGGFNLQIAWSTGHCAGENA